MGVALTVLLYAILGLLVLAAGAFCILTASIYYNYWKYSHIPSPKRPSFFLGHLPDFLRLRKETRNDEAPLSHQFEKWHKSANSPIFTVFMPGMTFVVPVDPQVIKEVVMQPKNGKSETLMTKFSNVFGERFIPNGIFSIPDYDTWKPRRQMYDSAFRKSYLQSIVPTFNGCVDLFIDKLRPIADGQTEVPMKQLFSEVTLDVISKVAFGTDFAKSVDLKNLGFKNAKGIDKMTSLLEHILIGMKHNLHIPWYQYLHPLEAEGHRESVRALRAIGRDCIQKRIKMVESGEKVPNDILTHILQVGSAREEVGIETLVDDFVTYYIAGQETTSNTLSFAVVMIGKHPSVLERLQTEVEEVLGSSSAVTKEDLDKLQFTEQVILETLRMYPPVFAISKETPPEGLTLGGYYIPGGTMLSLPNSLLQRMPEYFDEPDTFNPDRFDPENAQPSSFVFFPFGVGHRSCIGKHFALMETKMILARFVQTFTFSLPPDYKLVIAQRTTDQPKDNVPCKLELRSQ